MTIIEIVSQDNGAHRNQTGAFHEISNGWAVIPDGMETPNFPFGEITVEEIDGVIMVNSWTPGVVPDPEPTPDPGPTSEERLTALEAAMLAMMEVQGNV